jgi:hypothetical protein
MGLDERLLFNLKKMGWTAPTALQVGHLKKVKLSRMFSNLPHHLRAGKGHWFDTRWEGCHCKGQDWLRKNRYDGIVVQDCWSIGLFFK